MAVDRPEEPRSLALTPTWSVATVLTVFVVVSLIVERSIHHLSWWLHKTKRNPLFEAVEKMKSELMLLGFISLMLSATSSSISNICIESKYYNTKFSPCKRSDAEESDSDVSHDSRPHGRKLLTFSLHVLSRRVLSGAVGNTCKEIYTWRPWENEAHSNGLDNLAEITKELTMRRQSTLVQVGMANFLSRNRILVWVTCFFRQFGESVTRDDYLTLRMGFITNHNLTSRYDFHSYMISSMEEEFKEIVGISAQLWGFVIAFMLLNINGSNLYFWISIIPFILVLLVGAKLQHVIATLALENAGISGSFAGPKLRPRDELFWFNRPELLLSLIHFSLFQNAFELASFFWFWWQFGYDSCFLRQHLLVYIRLILGFAGQFLCSYSTLPLYALVTQMGTYYKAALIPPRIRKTIEGWGKEVKRKRRLGTVTDDSTVRSCDRSTIYSSEDNHQDVCQGSHADGSTNQINHNQATHSNVNGQSEIEMQTNCAGSMVVGANLNHDSVP